MYFCIKYENYCEYNMVLNYIWIAFFFIAFIVGMAKMVFMGDTQVFPDMMNSTFSSAKTAFEISLGLTGVLAFWLGIMRVGERGGLINTFSRWLSPFFSKLFPDIPQNHPVYGNIFMNFAANMLGLDNAATPLGLKAMAGLQELNEQKDTASNPMIMFLVLNTSGLCIIPVSIMVYRAQLGAAQPTDIFIPILLATCTATLIGILVTALVQRINILDRTLLLGLGSILLFVSLVVWGFSRLDRESMNIVATTVSNILLFVIIIGFLFSQIFSPLSSLWIVAFALILCANWFALSLSIREIVQEKSILRNEFRKGQKILPVLASKSLLPVIAAFVQTLVVYAFVAFRMSLHSSPAALATAFACTVLPAVAIGLFVSSLSRNSGQANAFLPLLIIPQVALAGALVPLDQMQQIGKALSTVIWSRYNQKALLDTLLERQGDVADSLCALALAIGFYIFTAIVLFRSKKAK